MCPQVRQRRVWLPNRASVTSQRGHSHVWPQWSQTRYEAYPRRLRNRIALSPASTAAVSALASSGEEHAVVIAHVHDLEPGRLRAVDALVEVGVQRHAREALHARRR